MKCWMKRFIRRPAGDIITLTFTFFIVKVVSYKIVTWYRRRGTKRPVKSKTSEKIYRKHTCDDILIKMQQNLLSNANKIIKYERFYSSLLPCQSTMKSIRVESKGPVTVCCTLSCPTGTSSTCTWDATPRSRYCCDNCNYSWERVQTKQLSMLTKSSDGWAIAGLMLHRLNDRSTAVQYIKTRVTV